jgi:hypothetical protein
MMATVKTIRRALWAICIGYKYIIRNIQVDQAI